MYFLRLSNDANWYKIIKITNNLIYYFDMNNNITSIDFTTATTIEDIKTGIGGVT